MQRCGRYLAGMRLISGFLLGIDVSQGVFLQVIRHLPINARHQSIGWNPTHYSGIQHVASGNVFKKSIDCYIVGNHRKRLNR